VAFSPNGKQVVSGSFDKSVKLWNVETGTELSTMSAHLDRVSSVAFSADGQWAMSGSSDKTIRLWDTHAVAQ
jgi:WD40 repeat protein